MGLVSSFGVVIVLVLFSFLGFAQGNVRDIIF